MTSLLQSRNDAFRFRFPDSFFSEELKEKYGNALAIRRGYFTDPVELLNQTVTSVEFLGMGNGTIAQEQSGTGGNGEYDGHVNHFGQRSRIDMNRFRHAGAEMYYRTAKNPLAMLDKHFTVSFNHILGFWNYFFMFESFFYQALRDTPSDDDTLSSVFNVELVDPSSGSLTSKVTLFSPLIEKIDPLELNYKGGKPETEQFKVEFCFNNIDYQFLSVES